MTLWRFPAIAVIGFLLVVPATALAIQQNESSATSTTQGDVLRLREDAPREYVVKKGDTLWDISEMFLDDPWLWPELWRVNDDIANPHLIYPGDRLYLSWVNGRPQLSRKAYRAMTPEGKIQPKGNPIPTFNFAELEPFLDGFHVMSDAQLQTVPQILGDNRGAPRINGMTPVFVSGDVAVGEHYRVYSRIEHFENMHLLRDVGGIRINMQHEQTAEGDLITPAREIRRGDVVMARQPLELPDIIVPKSGANVDGTIVASLSSREKHGKYDVMVINRGSDDGVAVGQMFQALRPGTAIFMDEEIPEAANLYKPYDNLSRRWRDTLNLPPQATAEMLVLKTYANASVVIVVDAQEWFEVGAYFVPKQIAAN